MSLFRLFMYGAFPIIGTIGGVGGGLISAVGGKPRPPSHPVDAYIEIFIL